MRVLHALGRRHRGLKLAGKMPVRKETRTVKGESDVTYRALPACGYGSVGGFTTKEEAAAMLASLEVGHTRPKKQIKHTETIAKPHAKLSNTIEKTQQNNDKLSQKQSKTIA